MTNQVTTLRMEQKFKKTSVGDIPVDWEVKELCELCARGPEYGANVQAVEFRDDLPRYVRITDISPDGTLSSQDKKSIKAEDAAGYLLGEGDVLFARSGATVGKTYLYRKFDGPCAFAGHTIRFTPERERLLPEFLFQFTHSDFYYQWVKGMFRAGAQPNINGSEYASLTLPIPPMREQKKIVEILSAVDEALERSSAVIVKTEALKAGFLKSIVLRGTGTKDGKLKDTVLGPLPEHWKAVKLGSLCMGGPEYGANVPAREHAEGIPRYIRITDIRDDGTLGTAPRGIAPEDAEPYIVAEGDVLFARSGATVGKTYLYRKEDGPCAFAGYLIKFRPDPTALLPEHLFYLTHSTLYYNWVKSMLRAGAQPNINAIEYSDLDLPIPPLEEQRHLVSILSSIDRSLSFERHHGDVWEGMKRALQRDLLTGKVRI